MTTQSIIKHATRINGVWSLTEAENGSQKLELLKVFKNYVDAIYELQEQYKKVSSNRYFKLDKSEREFLASINRALIFHQPAAFSYTYDKKKVRIFFQWVDYDKVY